MQLTEHERHHKKVNNTYYIVPRAMHTSPHLISHILMIRKLVVFGERGDKNLEILDQEFYAEGHYSHINLDYSGRVTKTDNIWGIPLPRT